MRRDIEPGAELGPSERAANIARCKKACLMKSPVSPSMRNQHMRTHPAWSALPSWPSRRRHGQGDVAWRAMRRRVERGEKIGRDVLARIGGTTTKRFGRERLSGRGAQVVLVNGCNSGASSSAAAIILVICGDASGARCGPSGSSFDQRRKWPGFDVVRPRGECAGIAGAPALTRNLRQSGLPLELRQNGFSEMVFQNRIFTNGSGFPPAETDERRARPQPQKTGHRGGDPTESRTGRGCGRKVSGRRWRPWRSRPRLSQFPRAAEVTRAVRCNLLECTTRIDVPFGCVR